MVPADSNGSDGRNGEPKAQPGPGGGDVFQSEWPAYAIPSTRIGDSFALRQVREYVALGAHPDQRLPAARKKTIEQDACAAVQLMSRRYVMEYLPEKLSTTGATGGVRVTKVDVLRPVRGSVQECWHLEYEVEEKAQGDWQPYAVVGLWAENIFSQGVESFAQEVRGKLEELKNDRQKERRALRVVLAVRLDGELHDLTAPKRKQLLEAELGRQMIESVMVKRQSSRDEAIATLMTRKRELKESVKKQEDQINEREKRLKERMIAALNAIPTQGELNNEQGIAHPRDQREKYPKRLGEDSDEYFLLVWDFGPAEQTERDNAQEPEELNVFAREGRALEFERRLRKLDKASPLDLEKSQELIDPAIERGYGLIVKALLDHLEKEASLQKDSGYHQLLHNFLCTAAECGQIDIVELLLEVKREIKEPTVPSIQTDDQTPLHKAARNGHLEVVRKIIRGANSSEGDDGRRPSDAMINARDDKGMAPLHEAVQHGHYEIVELLLEPAYQVDRNIRNGRGETPLDLAIKNGQIEVVARLWDKMDELEKSRFESGKSSLHESLLEQALQAGHMAIVQDIWPKGDSSEKATECLALAAWNGCLDILQWLVHEHNANIHAPQQGFPILYGAALGGHLAVVRWLVEEADAKVHDWSTDAGQPALFGAALGGQLPIVKWLVDHEADPAVGPNWRTPLCAAARGGHLNTVNWLLAQDSNDINIEGPKRNHPLTEAAQFGNAEVVKRLVEYQEEVGTGDGQRRAQLGVALKAAARSGRLEVAKWLAGKLKELEVMPQEQLHKALCRATKAAATGGKKQVAQWLVGELRELEDEWPEQFQKALCRATRAAARGGYMEVMAWLVEELKKPEAKPSVPLRDTICRALIAAAQGGHMAAVKWLTEKLREVEDEPKGRYQAPLREVLDVAVRGGHLAVVKWLVEDRSVPAEELDLQGCWEYPEVFEYLREKGTQHKNGESIEASVLYEAARHGHKEFVKWALELFSGDENRSNCLCMLYPALCGAARGGNRDIVHWLLEELKTNEEIVKAFEYIGPDGHKLLHSAVLGGNFEASRPTDREQSIEMMAGDNLAIVDELVRKLAASKDNVKEVIGGKPNDFTLLAAAGWTGNLAVVKRLLDFYLETINEQDICEAMRHVWLALYAAALSGHLEVVKYLLDERVLEKLINSLKRLKEPKEDQITQLIGEGWLERLSGKERLDEVRKVLLLENLSGESFSEHCTPISAAAMGGNSKLIRWLINECLPENYPQCVVGDALKNDFTLLHGAVLSGDTSTVEYLLRNGAEASSASGCLSVGGIPKFTPLYGATWLGYLEIIRLLVAHGVDVECETPDGFTPLYAAARRGYIGITTFLARYTVRIDQPAGKNGETPLYAAAGGGHLEVVKSLIEQRANVNAVRDSDRRTPLHEAANGGHQVVVAILVKNGADVNARMSNEETPLHDAAREGHAMVENTLIRYGANINAMNFEGSTPLHEAVRMKGRALSSKGKSTLTYLHQDTVDTLLMHGADLFAREFQFHDTPMHVAARHGQPALAIALRQRLAQLMARNMTESLLGRIKDVPAPSVDKQWAKQMARTVVDILRDRFARAPVPGMTYELVLQLAEELTKMPKTDVAEELGERFAEFMRPSLAEHLRSLEGKVPEARVAEFLRKRLAEMLALSAAEDMLKLLGRELVNVVQTESPDDSPEPLAKCLQERLQKALSGRLPEALREQLTEVLGTRLIDCLRRCSLSALRDCSKNMEAEEQEKIREVVEDELFGKIIGVLHSRNNEQQTPAEVAANERRILEANGGGLSEDELAEYCARLDSVDKVLAELKEFCEGYPNEP